MLKDSFSYLRTNKILIILVLFLLILKTESTRPKINFLKSWIRSLEKRTKNLSIEVQIPPKNLIQNLSFPTKLELTYLIISKKFWDNYSVDMEMFQKYTSESLGLTLSASISNCSELQWGLSQTESVALANHFSIQTESITEKFYFCQLSDFIDGVSREFLDRLPAISTGSRLFDIGIASRIDAQIRDLVSFFLMSVFGTSPGDMFYIDGSKMSEQSWTRVVLQNQRYAVSGVRGVSEKIEKFISLKFKGLHRRSSISLEIRNENFQSIADSVNKDSESLKIQSDSIENEDDSIKSKNNTLSSDLSDCDVLVTDSVGKSFYIDREEVESDFFFSEEKVRFSAVKSEEMMHEKYFESSLMDIEKQDREGKSTFYGFYFSNAKLKATNEEKISNFI